jgi:hypothetical protein
MPEVLSTWNAAQQRSAAAGGAPVTCMFVCRHRRRDGTYVWMETNTCITPTHFWGLERNISDRKALEARLLRA